jgi:cysteine desulfurase
MIYLDNGATTQVATEVVKEMDEVMLNDYGNPSSLHSLGRKAKELIEEVREKIAKEINATADEIIFTSGGSEANNLALNVLESGDHLITTKIEHHSIEVTLKELEKKGIEVSQLNVDAEGVIDLEELKKSFKQNTKLVSVIHGNNEIGTLQDLIKIGEVCSEKKVMLHSDCVQSFKKEKIDVVKANLSMLSLSAHKIHGPKGVGALYVNKNIKIKPLIFGGAQENKKRAGTENVPGIIGLGKAVELDLELDKVKELRDYFIKKVESEMEEVKLNGSRSNRLCNNANFSFKYVEGESLLMSLDLEGIAVSTGSACSSRSLKPSHVLMALGMGAEQAHGSIRFTFSKFNTKEEVDKTVDVLKKIVERLRKISPLRKK